MAKLKVKDFVETYDIKESTVKSYVHRKKLQKDAGGLIDTDNPINKLMISELKLKKATNKVGASTPKKKPSEKTEVEKPTGLTESQKQYADIDYRTRVATAETKEREAELKRIQLEKMAGNLLPVDLVQSILVINIQSLIKNFEQEIENMTSIVCGNDGELLALHTTQLKESLSKIVLKSKEDAMFEIENAINEYQEVRSRGERK